MTDWYERRHELRREQVFRLHDGDVVKLDRSVPGDGTKWYVTEWDDRHRNWSYLAFEIEPGDLKERLPDGFAGQHPERGRGGVGTETEDKLKSKEGRGGNGGVGSG